MRLTEALFVWVQIPVVTYLRPYGVEAIIRDFRSRDVGASPAGGISVTGVLCNQVAYLAPDETVWVQIPLSPFAHA